MTSLAQLEAWLKSDPAMICPSINSAAAFFKPMVIASLEEVGTLALNAVMAEAPKVLSGAEKLSNATATVITSLGASGKSVGTALAQTAVQSAYNVISNLIHPPAAPAP